MDSLFIAATIVLWGCVFGPCFVVQYFVSFKVLQSSRFTLIAFGCHKTVIGLLLFLLVPLVGL